MSTNSSTLRPAPSLGEPVPNPEAPLTPETMRARAVHRAASELRRGTPTLLAGDEPLLVVAAETASAAAIGELRSRAAAAPMLLLAPGRASAVVRRPVERSDEAVALRLSDSALDPATLRGLADPTVKLLLPVPPEPLPAPSLAAAALGLARIARLLPAVLAAPAAPSAFKAMAEGALLAVPGADVLAHPAAGSAPLERVAEAPVPLQDAPDTRIIAFRTEEDGSEHLAIVVGRPEERPAPLVRVHSECFTGDLLGSLRCDCGPQLRGAIRRMAEEGAGIVLYLKHEGRGIGLVNKLRAYALQDRGLDTLDANRALGWGADERNFLIAAAMLEALSITRLRLLTNNPDKLAALAACGIDVVGREPHAFAPNGVNDRYLDTKARRFGHLLP
jgi:GTP cyclohydrolase II